MLEAIRRIIARLLNWREPPRDPYAAVRQPLRRSPGGRSSAVAVAEPEPPGVVSAVGKSFRRTP